MKNDVFITLLCYVLTFGIIGAEGQSLREAMRNINELGVAALQPVAPYLIVNAVVASLHLLAEARIRRRQRGTDYTGPGPVIDELK